MSTTKSWYGVKTLYRWTPHGSPRNVDRFFDRGGTLVEERVVVFRATNAADAIRKAEREARAYSKLVVKNPYGEQVVTRYLGACDCFEMFGAPANGEEVFSETYRVASVIRDRAVCDRFLGSTSEGRHPRRRYSDGDVERMVRERLRPARRPARVHGLRDSPARSGRKDGKDNDLNGVIDGR